MSCVGAHFNNVVFHGFADFGDARFASFVHYEQSEFESDVNFKGVEFPRLSTTSTNNEDNRTGTVFDGVRFQKPSAVEWQQLEGRINTNSIGTWKLLEELFKRSGNLEGQNESMFQRRLLEGRHGGIVKRCLNYLDRTFWGYGVRPLRLFIWMLVITLLFAAIYWTQTRALIRPSDKFRSALRRLKFAGTFALQSAWRLDFGRRNSTTTAFRVITTIQSLSSKIMLLCFLHVLSNVSPLLHELFAKVLAVG